MVIDFKKIQEENKRLKRKKEKKDSKKFLKGKFLKKPSVNLIKSINAEKAIMRGTDNLALVREVQRPDVVPDTRSLFFNEFENEQRQMLRHSLIKEKEKEGKWLS